MSAITSFSGAFSYLSNFHPVEVTLDGIVYPSVEHAYQAAKTLDAAERAEIGRCRTAALAKKLGRSVKMREDWLDVRVVTMEALLRQKFADGTHFHRLLLATKPVDLIEGNSWGDRFWGVCDGNGENHLGKLLMNIRDEGLLV